MPAPQKDPYAILGVPTNASAETIRRAYRALVRRYHPDSGRDGASTARLQDARDAYELLSDSTRRRAYDRWHAERQPSTEELFTWRVQATRDKLPALPEEQMLYVLVEIWPGPGAASRHQPRNLVLVIDRSTSMQGKRLEYVKAAAHTIIEGLTDQDTLAVVTFSDRAETVVPSAHVTDAVRTRSQIAAVWASGGTEILQGLQAGLAQARRFHTGDALSQIILLTDGHTYGDEAVCIAEARRAGLEQIGISALGIGSDWNVSFLENLVLQAGGTCSYIAKPEQIRDVLERYVRNLSEIVVRDPRLVTRFSEGIYVDSAFRCFPYIERLGHERGEIQIGALHSSSHASVLLEIVVGPGADGETRLVQLELAGRAPGSEETKRLIVELHPQFRDAPEDEPIPTDVVNALNRICLFRMQEQAWLALKSGQSAEASRTLEAVATRLFDMGEQSLAQVARLEAGRVGKAGQASDEGQKALRYGTRGLGMR
jgi:Ca-activated chloride channel family protein